MTDEKKSPQNRFNIRHWCLASLTTSFTLLDGMRVSVQYSMDGQFVLRSVTKKPLKGRRHLLSKQEGWDVRYHTRLHNLRTGVLLVNSSRSHSHEYHTRYDPPLHLFGVCLLQLSTSSLISARGVKKPNQTKTWPTQHPQRWSASHQLTVRRCNINFTTKSSINVPNEKFSGYRGLAKDSVLFDCTRWTLPRSTNGHKKDDVSKLSGYLESSQDQLISIKKK
eukprot:scaffold11185_cov205-Amphora_coffeaeformis.AAC.5